MNTEILTVAPKALCGLAPLTRQLHLVLLSQVPVLWLCHASGRHTEPLYMLFLWPAMLSLPSALSGRPLYLAEFSSPFRFLLQITLA